MPKILKMLVCSLLVCGCQSSLTASLKNAKNSDSDSSSDSVDPESPGTPEAPTAIDTPPTTGDETPALLSAFSIVITRNTESLKQFKVELSPAVTGSDVTIVTSLKSDCEAPATTTKGVPPLTVTVPGDGNYFVCGYFSNSAAKNNPQSITIDTTVPLIADIATETYGNVFTPELKITDLSPTTVVWTVVTGGSNVVISNNGVSPLVSATLDGNYTLKVTVTDSFLNSSERNFDFIWKFCSGSNLSNSPFANSSELSSLGTSENPYRICTLAQLNQVRGFLSSYFELVSDIDAADTSTWGTLVDPNSIPDSGDEYYTGWEPIGTNALPFTGSFKGLGNKISYLYMRRPDQDYVGFFGDASAATAGAVPCDANTTIVNLSLLDADVEGRDHSGILAGNAVCSSISDVNTSGSVKGNTRVGGIVGDAERATVDSVSSTANVGGTTSRVGGLFGNGDGMKLSGCFATGNVTAGQENNGLSYTGGLVGFFSNSSATTRIRHCYATGSVTSVGGSTGGLFGIANGLDAKYVYSTGAVLGCSISAGSGSVGGLYGSGSGTISRSFSKGNVTCRPGGLGATGGVGGVATQQISDIYVSGNVSGQRNNGGILGWGGASSISRSYASGSVVANAGGGSCTGGIIGCAVVALMDHSFAAGSITATGSGFAHAGAVATFYENLATNLPLANYVSNFYVNDPVASALPGQLYILSPPRAAKKLLSYFQGPVTDSAATGEIYEAWNLTEIWSVNTGELPKLRCPAGAEPWPFDCATTWDAAQ